MAYHFATICLNGHVISSTDIEDKTPYCKNCGKDTISMCHKCNTFIRGAYEDDLESEIYSYEAPSYCHSCGNPFPWTERLINNAIELVSLDDNLNAEHKDIIKKALPDLIVETPSSPVATAKYKKFIPKAASYVQDGLKNLLVDVVSETVKKSIWG